MPHRLRAAALMLLLSLALVLPSCGGGNDVVFVGVVQVTNAPTSFDPVVEVEFNGPEFFIVGIFIPPGSSSSIFDVIEGFYDITVRSDLGDEILFFDVFVQSGTTTFIDVEF